MIIRSKKDLELHKQHLQAESERLEKVGQDYAGLVEQHDTAVKQIAVDLDKILVDLDEWQAAKQAIFSRGKLASEDIANFIKMNPGNLAGVRMWIEDARKAIVERK